ncbi:MAG: DUF2723 domain-containing protein [Caldilineales bacterium]|nr:DUF2723 domain-containing protein [Caldilineales bacterium]MDW8318498.1 DUF2723 domain-containing protein [Anaerolineae bacterium]
MRLAISHRRLTAPWVAGAALLLAALALYLATLDTGLRPGELAGGDLITHQYAQVQGRPSNAPGYPLYTMGGWLWFHGWRGLLGPQANATAILSAYSTFWALLALGLLYVLLVRLTGRWLLSALATAFYAVTYFFWYYAVTTEQYASAVAHTLAIVAVAFAWEEEMDRVGPAGSRRSDRLLMALAFLSGLTLAHLVTVALIVPPLVWLVLSRQPGVLRRPRLAAKAAAWALLPLLSYVFIYVRGAQHPEWRGAGEWPSTWAWFWDFVSTRQGREELTWSLWPLWTAEFPSLIWRELTPAVLVGGLVGVAALGRRRALFIGGTLALYAVFCFIDRLGNWFQVIMPAYALLVMTFGAGLGWLLDRMEPCRPTVRAVEAAVLVGLAVLVALRAAWSWPGANQRNRPEDTALLPGQAILADNPAPGAAILGTYDEMLSLRYLTEIAGQRPDLTAVDPAAARHVLAAGQPPLYVTAAAAPLFRSEVSADAPLSSAGLTLIRAHPRPVVAAPADIQRLDRPIGDGLTLVGYRAQPLGAADGQRWQVRLVWRADAAIGHDWSVSVRPLVSGAPVPRSEGGIVQKDLVHPVHGYYPTSQWQAGEVVVDDYLLEWPADVPPDAWQVVIYRVVDGQFDNLAVLELANR